MLKFGFLIKDGAVYDSKIQSFELKTEIIDSNVLYSLNPISYKRLYFFEPLLMVYSVDEVFRILRFNKRLRKAREKKQHKMYVDKMANYSVVGNYPPSDLMPRMFMNYKICQELKKMIDN